MIFHFHPRRSQMKRKLGAIRGVRWILINRTGHGKKKWRTVCNQYLFGAEFIRVILLNYHVRRCIGSRFLVYRYVVFDDDVPDISHKSCGSHVCGGTRTSRTSTHILTFTKGESHIHGRFGGYSTAGAVHTVRTASNI